MDVRPTGGDNTRELVPENHRVRARELSLSNVDVGAAHSSHLDPDEDLSRSRQRHRHPAHPHGTPLLDDRPHLNHPAPTPSLI